MTDSPDETDSVGDPVEDGQITIKIPNPKAYQARQSMWIGRRGKPRCDHCRLNNLKCDRVLPTCNHCSWAAGRECKYTPLPTPAHRGIPRCDRCRRKNLKCDRNLPVCNHCSGDNETECNYTPKKRHKMPTGQPVTEDTQPTFPAKAASFIVAEPPHEPNITGETKRGHSFYGQNVASSRNSSSPHLPSGNDEDSLEPEPEVLSYPHTGRFTADYAERSGHPTPPYIAPHPPPPSSSANPLSFISHSFAPGQGMIISSSHVQPWFHPSFAPLPDTILQWLTTVDSAEMPSRETFEDSLSQFLAELMPELRETACLSPDTYSTISRSLHTGDVSKLSASLRTWVSCHHLCSGSDKYSLILMPRDSIFQIGQVEAQKLRSEYCAIVDGNYNIEETPGLSDTFQAFERLPVRNQIYDVLAYAHRAHASPSVVLFEVRKAGVSFITWPMIEMFIRLCPLCSLRGKRHNSHVKPEPPQ